MAAVISNADGARWNEAGFVKLAGFLTRPQHEQLQAWVDDVASWPADRQRWMHHYEQTERGVCLARTENFAPYHEGLHALLTTGKIIDVASELLGQPAVLYKEKINYKYPGGGGYAAHQDAPAYAFVRHHVTCLVAIDPAAPDNGCLFFAAGLHQHGLMPLDGAGCIDPRIADMLTWEPAPLAGGDALFFGSYAPHKSPPNTTDRPRRSLYLTYNALSEGDRRAAYYEDKRRALAERSHDQDAHPQISKIGHFRGKPVVHSSSAMIED